MAKKLSVVSFQTGGSRRQFLKRFKAERAAFLEAVEGIPDEGTRQRFTSLILGRLMFVYFLQNRGFLDGDRGYLRAKLALSKQHRGDSFYPGFFCPLLFEGMAKRESERSGAVNELLGRVPYLGRGLFSRQQDEARYRRDIRIADAAFERILDFFDGYKWRLDEIPPRGDGEIGLDVLGDAFEQHLDQRQMGAYYTQEDVTGYIARNTVIPRLLDMVRETHGGAFEAEGSLWLLLQANPDRYIYPAVKKGAELPLPPEVAAGLDDVGRRATWNGAAFGEYALPTEKWREVVARRRRYQEVKARLAEGAVRSPDDLIACNLDVNRFTLDVIDNCDNPELLRAIHTAVRQITVLDPTCGAGAFLFAVLSVLAPLHEACLERMAILCNRSSSHAPPDTTNNENAVRPSPRPEGTPSDPETQARGSLAGFRETLRQVATYPSRHYYVLHSIIANNLFGVDIMEEAVEICKLRFLLTLLAQVERAEQLGRLPDLDLSIRAGDTLRPFLWTGEFDGVLPSGGFDVVVGNPPYVEDSALRKHGALQGYETASCGNLYALVAEQSLRLCRPDGRYGLVVQLSSVSTRNMTPLQTFIRRNSQSLFVSCFAERPQQLFAGVCIPLAILLGQKGPAAGSRCKTSTTGLYRWHESERASLFQRLSYCSHTEAVRDSLFYIPKLGSALELGIWERLFRQAPIGGFRLPRPNGNTIYYRTAGGRYWKVILSFPFEHESSANKMASLDARLPALVAVSVLSSSLFWWYYTLSFDIYNLKDYVLFDFRFNPDSASPEVLAELARLGGELMADYKRNVTEKTVYIKSKRQHATFYEYLPRLSKPIIDKIDRLLAQHYGFTSEETDFLVNYDAKYRMGGMVHEASASSGPPRRAATTP